MRKNGAVLYVALVKFDSAACGISGELNVFRGVEALVVGTVESPTESACAVVV